MPGLLSFFHRAEPVVITAPVEPPPDKAARRAKEESWLASIRGRSKTPASPSSPASVAESVGASPTRQLRELGLLSAPRAQRRSSTAVKSATAAFNAGIGDVPQPRQPLRARQASNGTVVTSPELAATFAFVPATGVIGGPVDVIGDPSEVATKSLAVRLQELSVANADGLLEDNEYRQLRAALFDRFAAAGAEMRPERTSEQCDAHLTVAAPTLSPSTSRLSVVTEPAPSSASVVESVASRRRSIRSARSAVTSLFRPSSSQSLSAASRTDEWTALNASHGRETSNDAESMFSIRTAPNAPAFTRSGQSLPSLQERGASSPPRTSPMSPGSIRSTRTSVSYRPGSTSMRQQRQRASVVATSLYDVDIMSDVGGTDVGTDEGGENKSSAELRREIAALETERDRLLEQMETLTTTLRAKHGLPPSRPDRIRSASEVSTRSDSSFGRHSRNSLASPRARPSLFGSDRGESLAPASEVLERDDDVPSSAFNSSDEAERVRRELRRLRERTAGIATRYAQRLEYQRVLLRSAMIREGLSR